MRSHMLNLPVPPKLPPQTPEFHQSSEEEEYDEKGQLYGLRENPKRSIRLVDPEFSFPIDAAGSGSVVVQDRESETESSKNPTGKRSKRNHKEKDKIKKCKFIQLSKAESWAEPEPVSSISDTTNEEDVAYCLMMLSRDKWKQQKKSEQETEDESESESDSKLCKNRTRGRYKCETCNKVFKSYQALGGHRASHSKIKRIIIPSSPVQEVAANVGKEERKIHECPVCFRVFPSGQAFGGHKRSHVIGSVTTTTTPPAPAKNIRTQNNFIDLNLPAPVEDDEDYSQFELSVVSDD